MSRSAAPFVTHRPVDGDDLCGREPVLDRLVGFSADSPPVAVTGEPGAGFTSLARELARRWSETGRRTLRLDLSLAEDEADVRALWERADLGGGDAHAPAILLDGVGRLGEAPELAQVIAELPDGATLVVLGPAAGRAVSALEKRDPSPVELKRIPFAAWLPYTLERFLRTDRWVGDEHVEACVALTEGHPRRTTALLAELWAGAGDGRVGPETVRGAWRVLLGRADAGFLELLAGLTANQRRVLRGLAAETGGEGEVRPYASEFLRRHGLSSPSSVQRCLQSLEQRWLTRETPRGPTVRDPLLAAWLRRQRERAVDGGDGHPTQEEARY